MKWSHSLKGIDASEFSDWRRMRGYFARRAYIAIRSTNDKPLVLWDGDEVVGIAAIDWDYIRGYLFVDFLATKRRGYGAIMMRKMREMAKRRKCGVALIAEKGAWGFYRKLKMQEDRLFTWKLNHH